MKHIALACIAVAGFAFANTPEAEAGGRIAISIGGPGYGFGYRSVGYPVYRPYGYGYGHGVAFGGARVWHGASQWNYGPGYSIHRSSHYRQVAPLPRYYHAPGQFRYGY